MRFKVRPATGSRQGKGRVGVYGAADERDEERVAIARRVGALLGAAGCEVITGACSGLPYAAAHAAGMAGAIVTGYSPVLDLEAQRRFTPDDDLSIYSRLLFVPDDFPYRDRLLVAKKYRNVISTANVDRAVVLGGSWGTLSEVCCLVDYGVPFGIVSGLGGIVERIAPPAVIVDDDPERVIGSLLADL